MNECSNNCNAQCKTCSLYCEAFSYHFASLTEPQAHISILENFSHMPRFDIKKRKDLDAVVNGIYASIHFKRDAYFKGPGHIVKYLEDHSLYAPFYLWYSNRSLNFQNEHLRDINRVCNKLKLTNPVDYATIKSYLKKYDDNFGELQQ